MKHTWCATAALTSILLSSSSLFAAANPGPNPSPAPPPSPVSPGPEDGSKTVETFKSCQTRSPNTGSFFDLNPIRILRPPEDDDEKKSFYSSWGAEARNISWHARGYDYPANFTINFCGGVVEDVKNVVDVERSLWTNISAFYRMDDKIYSIGQQNDELVFRGRKMTLNYTNGSPCPDLSDSNGQLADPDSPVRRKSTLISLLCERDPLAPKASVAFVGTTDECTYFFEARSSAACPAVNFEKQQVGPSGVFGLIFCIAIIVYVVGGVVYQRAVLHQRGWRQLPNYALWASIANVVGDVLIIIFSSCMRCFSSGGRGGKPGYGHVPNGNNGYANGSPPSSLNSSSGRGRSGDNAARGPFQDDVDDETRLIDQLDEVWDD